MKLLCISDLHADQEACLSVVARSKDADVVVLAGDFARQHHLLEETIGLLRAITCPCVLVPGNNERPQALRDACAGWAAARVLHGQEVTIDGLAFFGLGAGVPVTPFGDWSFDLREEEAADLLRDCPEGAVLVSHSPPRGHGDITSAGAHVGSVSVMDTIERRKPRLVVCGHVHDSWGYDEMAGPTRIVNAGPGGLVVEL